MHLREFVIIAILSNIAGARADSEARAGAPCRLLVHPIPELRAYPPPNELIMVK